MILSGDIIARYIFSLIETSHCDCDNKRRVNEHDVKNELVCNRVGDVELILHIITYKRTFCKNLKILILIKLYISIKKKSK